MKKILSLFTIFITVSFYVFSGERELPDEYYKFRDDMYNFAKTPEELEKDFDVYVESAIENLSGYDLNLALSRYEYILGRAYAYDKQNEIAAKHFDIGMEYAEKAIEEKSTVQSQLAYVENVCGNCGVRPFSWVIIWGPKVRGLTQKILKIAPHNGATLYLNYAQDVYAPKPFCNYKLGIKEMLSILDDPDSILEKDDEFNILSAIGYAYIQQWQTFDMKYAIESRSWFEKALEIYPENKFVKDLLKAANYTK